MQILLSDVIKMNDYFTVSPDNTEWESGAYTKVGKQTTPLRAISPYKSFNNVLEPINEKAAGLKDTFGIYCISLSVPFPSIYVGIAASGSSAPEGILTRIKKHCVKIMGSNVASENSTSVSHTKGWAEVAPLRYSQFLERQTLDKLEDVRFCVFEFGNDSKNKELLELYENLLVSEPKLFDLLCSYFQFDCNSEQVFKLTSNTKSKDLQRVNKDQAIKIMSDIFSSKSSYLTRSEILREYQQELSEHGVDAFLVKTLPTHGEETVELVHLNLKSNPSSSVYLRVKSGKTGRISIQIAAEGIKGIKVDNSKVVILNLNGWLVKNSNQYFSHEIHSVNGSDVISNILSIKKMIQMQGKEPFNTFQT